MKRPLKSSRFVFSAIPSFEPRLALRRDPFILLFALFVATSVAGAV
jgi:hypothetical protein